MPVSKQDLLNVVDKLENGNYTIYFWLPDFDKPSGGVGLTYDHVRILNENGFNAKIIHTKKDFKPEWLGKRLDGVPIVYLEEDKLELHLEDFFFIPEGFPQLMENLQKQGAPCKKIVFCQNWYYVLNALPAGVMWNTYGIYDCMSVSKVQSSYLKAIMPFLRIKNVVGSIDDEVFTPPEHLELKKPVIAFKNSRDGLKGYNVIKTFYAIFPQFRWIQFKELQGLSTEDYAAAIREAAFYLHMDEYSSWGTAPIEAFLSKSLVAGWDGVGGREYMNNTNCWLVPNGDIFALAAALGNMVETWLLGDVSAELYSEMKTATTIYSKSAEKDSIILAHNEYREDRIKELHSAAEHIEGDVTNV